MSTPLGPRRGVVTYSARGSTMQFEAIAADDEGDISVMERTLPACGRRPSPRRHANCSGAYFVFDGVVSVRLKDRDHELGPEQFLLVPRGALHTFGNASESEARLLVIHAPAMDRHFAELHELWHADEPPTQEQEQQLMRRHGMETA